MGVVCDCGWSIWSGKEGCVSAEAMVVVEGKIQSAWMYLMCGCFLDVSS